MFGELGEKMRRKLNERGIGIISGTLIVVGATAGVLSAGSLIARGNNSVVLDILRQIAIWLDSMFFWLSSAMYSIFYELSASSVLSTLNLAAASQRLYTLLGIFMLFRLAFSFIKYIVNPDDMEKGTSKFITNLAVSLALIVSVPWIFNRAFALQNYIMESNVIGNLILGMNNDKSSEDTFNAGTYGQSIAFLTFSAFYRPNASISGLEPCANLLVYYDDYVVPEGEKKVAVTNSGSDERDKQNNKIAACVNALNGTDSRYSLVFGDMESSTELGTMFYIASKRQDMSLLTDPDVWKAKYSNRYVIDYTAIVSTIALGFLALLFMSFSFDVAIRNVKLCFLQIIAPIPIILNIEPGDTKGDKKSLGWWTKECLKTYVDLFIRVATVYFGAFLINILFTGNSIIGSNNSSPWFKIFMIFGILLFVKQIPEMIGKAFGIDVKGQFSLNPLKRIGENRLASMALGGAAGLGLSALGTGISAYRGARSSGANRVEAIRRAMTGGVGGALHGGFTGAAKGVKGFRDITSNARDNWGRSGRIAAANVGTTYGQRLAARAAMAAGVPTRSDRIANEAKAMEDFGNAFGNMKSFALGSKENIGIERFTGGGLRVTSSEGLDNYYIPLLQRRREEAARRNDTDAVDAIDKQIAQCNSMEYRNLLDSGRVALKEGDDSGVGFSNVKDANDYLERLKASGASVAEIKAAEDMTSNFVNNYIDAFRSDSTHAIGAMWNSAMREYDQYADVMEQYGIGRATDAVSLKGNITPAKSGASAHKLSEEAEAANRAKAAAGARGPGGHK